MENLNVWNCACMFRNFNGTHVIFWLMYHLACYTMKGSWLLGWCWGHLKVIVSDRAGEPKLPHNDEITIATVVFNDSSELRKVKRLRPHPFWGTSKSKLYFFSNIFSKKHTYVTRIASIRCVQICWGQQANLELPSEGLGDRMSTFKITFVKGAIKQQFLTAKLQGCTLNSSS